MTLDRASQAQTDNKKMLRRKDVQRSRVPHVCLRAFTEAHGRVNLRRRLPANESPKNAARTHASRTFERSSCEAKSEKFLAFAVEKVCLDLAFHVRRRKEAEFSEGFAAL